MKEFSVDDGGRGTSTPNKESSYNKSYNTVTQYAMSIHH